jgi:DNA-binding transcriptional MerR regulator
MDKFLSITEVSKILELVNPVTKKPLNHVLRYWEKEFKIIRPKKINNRRYYSSYQLQILKMIKFYLKNKGMTVSGVKKLINMDINKLDDHNDHGLKADYYKKSLKLKSKLLLKKINKIKNYGKKNSS